jgi:hypothetical protein
MKSNYAPSTLGRVLTIFGIAILLGISWLSIHPKYARTRKGGDDLMHAPTTEQLAKAYKAFNEEDFEGKLPKDTTFSYYYSPIRGAGVAYTRCPLGIDNGCTIRFNTFTEKCATHVYEDMLHEMCHLKTWGQNVDVHGKQFQGCMLSLAEKGAMGGYW